MSDDHKGCPYRKHECENPARMWYLIEAEAKMGMARLLKIDHYDKKESRRRSEPNTTQI
jgi:hypothetical protein